MYTPERLADTEVILRSVKNMDDEKLCCRTCVNSEFVDKIGRVCKVASLLVGEYKVCDKFKSIGV